MSSDTGSQIFNCSSLLLIPQGKFHGMTVIVRAHHADYTTLLPLIPPWVKTRGDTLPQREKNHPLFCIVRLEGDVYPSWRHHPTPNATTPHHQSQQTKGRTARGSTCATDREGWTEESSGGDTCLSPGCLLCLPLPGHMPRGGPYPPWFPLGGPGGPP